MPNGINPDNNKNTEELASNEVGGVVFEEKETPKESDKEPDIKAGFSTRESEKPMDFSFENYGKTLLKPLRTFALDLKEAGGGGKGELREEKKVPKKKVVSRPDVPPMQIPPTRQMPPPTPKPAPGKPKEPIKIKQPEVSRAELRQELTRSGILSEKESAKPERSPNVPVVHTYRDDATSVVQKKKLTVASIARAAEEKRRKESEAKPEKDLVTKNLFIVVFSIALIIAGSLSGWFFYKNSKEIKQVSSVGALPSIIFANTELQIALSTRDNVVFALENHPEVTTARVDAKVGGILHIYLVSEGVSLLKDRKMSVSNVLRWFNPPPPDQFIRSLQKEYMVGFHKRDSISPAAPFFILTTDSFENTFRGMLDWEEVMQDSLSPLFEPYLEPNVITNSTSTNIVVRAPVVLPSLFRDAVVKNIDTRRMRDGGGNVVLLYAFPNAKTVIITTNEETLLKVFSLLSAS